MLLTFDVSTYGQKYLRALNSAFSTPAVAIMIGSQSFNSIALSLAQTMVKYRAQVSHGLRIEFLARAEVHTVFAFGGIIVSVYTGR